MKSAPLWVVIVLGAAVVASTTTVAALMVTSQNVITQQHKQIVADAKQNKNLKAQRTAAVDDAAAAGQRETQCRAKVNALENMRTALSSELTKWGANPLGYTIDGTQISRYRDIADGIVC
jgi:hypothetical protein